jgi:hypothetical protein
LSCLLLAGLVNAIFQTKNNYLFSFKWTTNLFAKKNKNSTSIRHKRHIFCLILTSAAFRSACDVHKLFNDSNFSKSPRLNENNKSTSHWSRVPFNEPNIGCMRSSPKL